MERKRSGEEEGRGGRGTERKRSMGARMGSLGFFEKINFGYLLAMSEKI